MTDRLILQQAKRQLRHESETTLLRRDGRYVNRALIQAEAAKDDRAAFWLLIALSALGAPGLFLVMFTYFALTAPVTP